MANVVITQTRQTTKITPKIVNVQLYKSVTGSGGSTETGETIATKYEALSNTNKYTDNEKSKLQSLDPSQQHAHSNKSVLDATEQSFTTVLKDKLDAIDAGSEPNRTPQETIDIIDQQLGSTEWREGLTIDLKNNEILVGIGGGQSEEEGAQAGSIDNTLRVPDRGVSINGKTRPHRALNPVNINWTIDTTQLLTLEKPQESFDTSGSFAQTSVSSFLLHACQHTHNEVSYQSMAKGGFSVDALSAGTSDFYNMCAVLQAVQRISGKLIHPVLYFYQGAADAFLGTPGPTYESAFRKIRRDLAFQVKRIRRDNFELQMYVMQFVGMNYTTPVSKVEAIANAQFDAICKDPNIHFIAPNSAVKHFADYVHPDADGENRLGKLKADRLFRKTGDMIPTSITDNGTEIIITYPYPPKVTFDIVPVGGNYGLRSDGVIDPANTRIEGNAIIAAYTGTATYVSLGWNTSSTGPEQSNTNIISEDGAYAICFKKDIGWTKPAEEQDSFPTYLHTLSSIEEEYASDASFWITGENSTGSKLVCKGKKGVEFNEQSGTPVTFPTIDGRVWIQANGDSYFEADRDAYPLVDHTFIAVVLQDTLAGATRKIISNHIGANEPYFGTYQARFRYFSPTAGGGWYENIAVAGEKQIVSAHFNAVTGEYYFQLNQQTPIQGTSAALIVNKAISGTKTRLFADGRYDPAVDSTKYREKLGSISGHVGSLIGTDRHKNMVAYLADYYGITV